LREERRAALESQSQPPQGELTAGNAQDGDEQGGYRDEFAAQQQGFDDGQGYDAQGYDNGYQDQQQGGGYDQQAYDDGGQGGYDDQQQQSYGEGYYAPNGNPPQNDAFQQNGGFPQNGDYRNGSYAEPGQGGQAPAGATGSFPGFGERRQEDDWPQHDGYRNGYQDQYPAQAPEGESSQAADARESDSVGFDRPGPAPSDAHALTDAGLPRRGSSANGAGGTGGAGRRDQEPPATTAESNGDDTWRSANDERWEQASALRKPKAGGVTSSGLPRRVPKANLVQGAAETTPQGGPQVSRAPEDVRGRLSNLRRGVQRGRTAGSETNGQGFGPDSTYNQER
jgi:hypothetical protein